DSTEDDLDIESVDSDYDSDALGLFERQKKCEVTDNLDRDEHDCGEVFENRRATPGVLAHYFKRKIQNNPKFKIKEDRFSLNVSDSKLKRVKRMVLEKLEGSYLDEYNKLEAYAQELRETNPGTDVVIQISKDAMEEGKRRF
ncbi:hypothetical protein A4A49_62501, partial [Nicotiana attenuata]